nr:MAG TPA: hypothetical protein [Caudoviricetes sp.]
MGKIKRLTHSFFTGVAKNIIISIPVCRNRWQNHSGKHPCRATYLYTTSRSDRMQVNIFQTRADFPAAFSFCYIQNRQRILAYLTKSPKNRK